MSDQAVASCTRRIVVPDEPLLTAADFDYADAFEVRLSEPDVRSAESWMRSGLEEAPLWMCAAILFAHRVVLQFRPDHAVRSTQILGWQIVHNEPDLVRVDADGPLLRGTLIARRTAPDAAILLTFLWYRKPAARWLWVAVGPVHRSFAPRLLRHAAERGAAD